MVLSPSPGVKDLVAFQFSLKQKGSKEHSLTSRSLSVPVQLQDTGPGLRHLTRAEARPMAASRCFTPGSHSLLLSLLSRKE